MGFDYYKDFRSEERCSSCFCGCVETNGQAGCGMTKEMYAELGANETLENLACGGKGVSPDIANSQALEKTTENQVITYTDYKKYKEELDTELQKSAESFVRIGYLLKVARDTNILHDSGYANVNEFAQKEYGLDKTQVSRFININDKFSEDGYSERLKTEYRGYGYAKLSLMLLLPEEVNAMLSPAYSKAEIQAVKEEVDEENKISDIEVMLEEEDEMQQGMENNLTRVVNQIGKDIPELYVALFKAYTTGESVQRMKELLAPAGEKIYSVRLTGVGKLMLSVKENEDRLTLVNVRTGEMEEYDWGKMKRALADNMDFEKNPEESWQAIYGEGFPKKEEVAPVQQEKSTQRKESKVSKAKVEKPGEKKKTNELVEKVEKYREEHPEEAKKWDDERKGQVRQPEELKEGMQQNEPDAAVEETEKEPEPQVEGQTDIYNYPEYLPEGMGRPEEKTKDIRTQEEVQQCQRKMLDGVIELQGKIVKKDYISAKKKCQELMWYLDQEVKYEEHNA